MTFSMPIPLGLYIHIPWCVKKCPYCDFNSHAASDALPEREYIDALLSDLEQDLQSMEGRIVETIFIGGGTPSLFSPESIERLLVGVTKQLSLEKDAEITLEANPGTVESGKFAEFSAAGINRLSIGVQSFKDDALRRLGRIHSAKDALRAAEQAHDAGLNNFNLDLMFGLPTQTPKDAIRDLANAVSLEPTHISWYQLTLEPNTHFHHSPPSNLPSEETLWQIQQQGQEFLAQHAFRQYEISAYSRHQPCKHNLNYWRFGDYLGIGAGAHAKITDSKKAIVMRTAKTRNPRDYLRQSSTHHSGSNNRISNTLYLSQSDLILEFMMNALRLTEGFEPTVFEQHTGLPLDNISELLEQATDKGLLHASNEKIQASPHGQRYLNNLLGIFMSDDDISTS